MTIFFISSCCIGKNVDVNDHESLSRSIKYIINKHVGVSFSAHETFLE